MENIIIDKIQFPYTPPIENIDELWNNNRNVVLMKDGDLVYKQINTPLSSTQKQQNVESDIV